jgi:hypothetical protein
LRLSDEILSRFGDRSANGAELKGKITRPKWWWFGLVISENSEQLRTVLMFRVLVLIFCVAVKARRVVKSIRRSYFAVELASLDLRAVSAVTISILTTEFNLRMDPDGPTPTQSLDLAWTTWNGN